MHETAITEPNLIHKQRQVKQKLQPVRIP